MTLYLDTSDLVKLYIDEPGADRIQSLVRDAHVVVTSIVAYAEVRSTLARRRRERLMTAPEMRDVVRQLDADWLRFVAVTLDDELGRSAGRLADAHGLRGCDAVHLASFESLLGRSEDDDVRFSCADDKLARAARNLG